MSTRASAGFLFALMVWCSGAILAQEGGARPETKQSIPLFRAHAHNDYEHTRPLFDALDQGFCSVEADIYLVEGKLLVAHDRDKVRPERTLQALYLDPLRDRARQNGGRVYRGGPSITLLIDVKSGAEETYAALRSVLQEYASVLTKFSPTATETNAITVIVSGNRARQMMASEKVRYAAYDGRLEDLDAADSRHFIPLVSESWSRVSKWRGAGQMPADETERLAALVRKAHEQGRRVRFWATPDTPSMWTELSRAGVDLINADDLVALARFLRADSLPR
jgi:glycerophosphoryl diester phosphodiesterase family protein